MPGAADRAHPSKVRNGVGPLNRGAATATIPPTQLHPTQKPLGFRETGDHTEAGATRHTCSIGSSWNRRGGVLLQKHKTRTGLTPQIARYSSCLGFRMMLKIDRFDTPRSPDTRAVWGSEGCSKSIGLTPQFARYSRSLGFRRMLKIDRFDTPVRQILELSVVQKDAQNR